MKTPVSLSFLLSTLLGVAPAALSQEEVPLDIFKAVELEVDTEAGFDYQFLSSPDLTDFVPIGPALPGDNEKQSMYLRGEDPQMFFKAERTPSSVQTIIPGLVSMSFDTAEVESSSSGMKASGVRAVSSEYDEEDYLIIDYELDVATQSLKPSSVEPFFDVGPTTSGRFLFFLNDNPEAFTVLQDGTPLRYSYNQAINIPATGSTLIAKLNVNQIMGWMTWGPSDSLDVTITDPDGEILEDFILSAGKNSMNPQIHAFKAGDFTIQLVPRSGRSATVKLEYENMNRQTTTQLKLPSGSVSASISKYHNSYKKYRIELTEGELFSARVSLNDASIALYQSNGKKVDSRGSTGTLNWDVVAPKTDNYWIVYYHDVWPGKSMTMTYSVTSGAAADGVQQAVSAANESNITSVGFSSR